MPRLVFGYIRRVDAMNRFIGRIVMYGVFAMIGGTPPVKWLQSIGVPYVDKPHSWSPPRTDQLARRHAR